MGFFEYTQELVKTNSISTSVVAIIGPGAQFNATTLNVECIYMNNKNEDIVDFCERIKADYDFKQVDLVIMSRVLEHIPLRDLDYYLYSIHSIMKKDAKLICIVPDMREVTNELKNIDENFDYFKLLRLNLELFSEGNNVWDRHCTWTDIYTMKLYLEREHLFRTDIWNYIDNLNTDLMPKELEFHARSL